MQSSFLDEEANVLYFGVGMGALLVVIGLATYFLAPRVGPNPFFGVRVGYSYASREVWDKSNRFGGAVIAAIGLLLPILAGLMTILGMEEASGMAGLSGVMMVLLLGSVGVMFVYTRNLARGAPMTHAIAPVKFRWWSILPQMITFLLVVALLAYFYPQLPQGRMATHFGLDDQPNGWMTRATFAETIIGLGAFILAMNVAIVLIATREPMIAFGRMGTRWQITPANGVIFMSIVFAMTNVIIFIAVADTIAFNLNGVHLFPLSLLGWMLLPFMAIIVGLFFVLAKRKA